MIKNIKIFFLIAFLSKSCLADYIVFTRQNNGTNEISIPNGEAWMVVNWWASGTGSSEVFILPGTTIKFIGNHQLYTQERPGDSPVGLIIKGPAIIGKASQLADTNLNYYLNLKKIETSTLRENISSTSVVIPSSANGDVDIKLEQSSDNVTWTECLPGTYNSSTVKRFFRLRAVEK